MKKYRTLLNIFRYFYRLGDMIEEIAQRIEQLETNQAAFNKRYLSKREAAAYLDKKPNYIDSLIRGREITYFQASGYAIYIDREELDKFITRTMFMSNDKIKESIIKGAKSK